MPAVSEKQRRFFGAELARKREGKKTKTDMSESDMEDFAKKKKKRKKKLPTHGSGLLSPLGQRTLAGYQQKWGDSEGHTKFEAAVEGGLLSRERMFKKPGPRHASGKFQSRPG
jgi:hypothetical protein